MPPVLINLKLMLMFFWVNIENLSLELEKEKK